MKQNKDTAEIIVQQLEMEQLLRFERKRQEELRKDKEEEIRRIERNVRINKRHEEVYNQFKKKFESLSIGDELVHKSLGSLSVDKLDDKTIYVTRKNDKGKMELERDIRITQNLKDIIKKDS